MYEFYEYLMQSQLGEIFGMTSVQMGKVLKKLGLRTPSGQATQKASELGLVSQAPPENGGFPIWHQEKTIEFLEKAGYRRVDVPGTAELVGPFSVLLNENGTLEIRDGVGRTILWGKDEGITGKLVRVLNLGHQRGVFKGKVSTKDK